MPEVKCINVKLGILTDELGDGSLCSPLQLLKFFCHVTLQIPTIRKSHQICRYVDHSMKLCAVHLGKKFLPVWFSWGEVGQVLRKGKS